MIAPDPSERITIDAALLHPFFANDVRLFTDLQPMNEVRSLFKWLKVYVLKGFNFCLTSYAEIWSKFRVCPVQILD
jgi:hypothetical protein